MRTAMEVSLLCICIAALLGIVVAIGTWGWSASCYMGHPGEPIRWSFPGGCELNVAGTWVTVGTARQFSSV
jgi:hypothetical protein